MIQMLTTIVSDVFITVAIVLAIVGLVPVFSIPTGAAMLFALLPVPAITLILWTISNDRSLLTIVTEVLLCYLAGSVFASVIAWHSRAEERRRIRDHGPHPFQETFDRDLGRFVINTKFLYPKPDDPQ